MDVQKKCIRILKTDGYTDEECLLIYNFLKELADMVAEDYFRKQGAEKGDSDIINDITY